MKCSMCERSHEAGQRCLIGVLLVCGGRDYRAHVRLWRVLDRMAERMQITAVRHGAAPGADTFAGEWADERGCPVEARPADWKGLGKSAGPRRNLAMLAEGGVVAVVAFPGGSGTAHMVREAKRAGLPVWEVRG